jgi:hypothetical protein
VLSLPGSETLQGADGPRVTAHDALQFFHVAVLGKVAQHLEDAARAGVERAPARPPGPGD